MKKPHTLCFIDDDEIYQYAIARSVKAHHLAEKVLVFMDGEEAMWFFNDNVNNNENLPDIIFLDINMPIMDGWQFLDEYLKLKPRITKPITIYMITSSVDPVDYEHAKRISEISDYVVKPIKPEILKELVEKYTIAN